MVITIVNSHPKYLIGGAELFMYYSAKEFVRQGHEVHMVSVYPRGVPHSAILQGVEFSEGIRVHHVPDVATDMSSAIRFLKVLESIPTDVYLKMFTEPSTILLAAQALWRHIPYVLFMSHDSHCLKDAGISVAARYRVSFLTKFLMIDFGFYRWSLRHAARLLVQNETQRKLLFENFSILADDIIKVGQPVPGSFREKSSPPIAIWNARFQPWKRPEIFFELARRLPQRRFVLGGPTKDDAETPYYQELQRQAVMIPNLSVSSFPETFEMFQQFSLYDQASVFIDTVERGGFENTLVQAWLRGVPVVSVSRDFDGVLEREGIGACVHGNMDALVEIVDRMLSQHEERKAVGERARAFAKREYDIHPIAERLLWHLRNAKEGKPRDAFQGETDLPI